MCFESGEVSADQTPSMRCGRCKLEFPKSKEQCPYCAGMSASQAKNYGKSVLDNVRNQNLGLSKIFIYGAIISLVILVLSFA